MTNHAEPLHLICYFCKGEMVKYKASYDKTKYKFIDFDPYYYECEAITCRNYYLCIVNAANNRLLEENWEYSFNGITYYMENNYIEKTFYLKGGGKEHKYDFVVPVEKFKTYLMLL